MSQTLAEAAGNPEMPMDTGEKINKETNKQTKNTGMGSLLRETLKHLNNNCSTQAKYHRKIVT